MTADVGARGRLRPLASSAASFPGWGVRLISLLLLLGLWQITAQFSESIFYPTPVQVAEAGWKLMWNAKHRVEFLGTVWTVGDLPFHIGVTLSRAMIAFVIAMVAGSAIGLVLGRRPVLNKLFDSWIMLGLNMPALVVAILCYIYLGLNDTALIAAVAINKVPLVAVTMREGASAIQPDLLQVAKAFRLGPLTTMRRVFFPQLYPYFMASARTGLALVWKIVLVFELLGFSKGVGFVLQLNWQLAAVDRLLAYAIGFIIVVMTIEALVMRPLERRATRWRL
jgi:NitT/TauT family transport system permease protein